ncbi:MAG: OmpA family protein, partial [Proteobacteria bacterium]|nr:OmpA family protein [Pseudomonadota bacterium]
MVKTKKNVKIYLGLLMIVTMTASMMLGCASTPKTNEALERARAAYSDASSNPDIVANAQVPMYDAKKSLERAEAAKELKDIDQKAYLAERQVQIAVAMAEQKKAEAEVERLNQERNRILMESRSLEAKQANMKADASAKEANQAKMMAIEKAQQLEIKQQEALEQMKKLELAKKEAQTRLQEIEQARKIAEEQTKQLELAKQESQAMTLEAEQAQKKAAELKAEIDALQAKQTDRGIVLTLGDVLFATNKANLQPGAMRTVDQLVEFLKKHTERMVAIEGHTDNRGSDTYNLGLSQRRADAVRDALVARGIDQARIQTVGKGEVYPVASNDTSAGRQQNR